MRQTRSGGAVLVVIWSMLALTVLAQAGSRAGARQTFEVASVRPNAPRPSTFAGAVLRVRVMPGGRFVATGASLADLIHFAYALRSDELVASGWSNLLGQRFDVEAKAGAGDVPRTSTGVVGPMNIMVQNLLTERFRLRARWEERKQSVLVLVRAREDGKLGPGLHASSVDCADPAARKKMQPRDAAPGWCTFSGANGRLQAAGHRMSDFANYLSRQLQRPVFDRTNLDGPFVIDMTSSSEGIPIPPLSAQLVGAPVSTDDVDPKGRPPLTVALKEQLGLALETRIEPVRRLVIEHVEAPSPN